MIGVATLHKAFQLGADRLLQLRILLIQIVGIVFETVRKLGSIILAHYLQFLAVSICLTSRVVHRVVGRCNLLVLLLNARRHTQLRLVVQQVLILGRQGRGQSG